MQLYRASLSRFMKPHVDGEDYVKAASFWDGFACLLSTSSGGPPGKNGDLMLLGQVRFDHLLLPCMSPPCCWFDATLTYHLPSVLWARWDARARRPMISWKRWKAPPPPPPPPPLARRAASLQWQCPQESKAQLPLCAQPPRCMAPTLQLSERSPSTTRHGQWRPCWMPSNPPSPQSACWLTSRIANLLLLWCGPTSSPMSISMCPDCVWQASGSPSHLSPSLLSPLTSHLSPLISHHR